MRSWTVLNVPVIIFFYLFYYRIGCYWMWLHIRRYSLLVLVYPAWCGVAWLFSKSVCVHLDWHLQRYLTNHLAVWSLEYFHSAALQWSHLLDFSSGWPWIRVVVKNVLNAKMTSTWIIWCDFCFCVLLVLQSRRCRLRWADWKRH